MHMFPSKPPDVPDEVWELELPSILGPSHPGFRGPPETPSPRSLVSIGSGASSFASLTHPSEASTQPGLNVGTQEPAATSSSTSADTSFLEWNVPSTASQLTVDVYNGDMHPAPTAQDPGAEQLAHFILQSGSATFGHISELLDLLPEKSAAKRRHQLCLGVHQQKCFSTGAYTFAHSTGIQLTALSYPRTTLVLTGIMRGMCPDATFASLALQRNIQLQAHRDTGNHPGFLNTIVPCSRWVGGCLWVQNEHGAHALDQDSGPGTMHRVQLPYIQFSPHCTHATTPWSQGDRTILIGYTPRHLHRLTASDRETLAGMGFNLPTELC